MEAICDFCGEPYEEDEEGMYCEENGKNYCLYCTSDNGGHYANAPDCKGCKNKDCGFSQ